MNVTEPSSRNRNMRNRRVNMLLNLTPLHSKKSREIIKQICNKHRLQKQISSIMKQNCFISKRPRESICHYVLKAREMDKITGKLGQV